MLSISIRRLFFSIILFINLLRAANIARDKFAYDKKSIVKKFYTNQWAVQLIEPLRVQPDKTARKHGFVNNGLILQNYYAFTKKNLRSKSLRKAKHLNYRLMRDRQIAWVEQQRSIQRYKRNAIDPLVKGKMWHFGGMKITEAWDAGFNGTGVVVTVVDDGVEKDHPELKDNFDERASHNFKDNNSNPTPRYDKTNSQNHGTRCAGEIGAKLSSTCNVGVAHGAKLGGIKVLDYISTDIQEAMALSFKRQYVDIYSNSWGPNDDGTSIEGIRTLTALALKEGAEQGRKGRGSIFVWASGNGGANEDDCNCDGFSTSIYTITISATTDKHTVPSYNERCSASLATTYSGGPSPESEQITTTDLHSTCTNDHTGTSAAAPLAAGICALALHANPLLTWRDMQHIVVRTANSDVFPKTSDWKINPGTTRNVSARFGYGLMDALKMVDLAKSWNIVPPMKTCTVPNEIELKIPNNDGKEPAISTVEIDHRCSDSKSTNVVYAENVKVRITLRQTQTTERGQIEIILLSPNSLVNDDDFYLDMESTLLSRRKHDKSKMGFTNWEFLTTHHWGENVMGSWKLKIFNYATGTMYLDRWDLILFGTTIRVGVNGGQSKQLDNLQHPKILGCCKWSYYKDQTVCEGCKDGKFINENECVSKCPPKRYEFIDKTEGDCILSSCRTCAPNCPVTCKGPNVDQCA